MQGAAELQTALRVFLQMTPGLFALPCSYSLFFSSKRTEAGSPGRHLQKPSGVRKDLR